MACGIGGAGKTTLAAEVASRVRDRDPGLIQVGLAGPLTLESLLGAIADTIRGSCRRRGPQRRPGWPGHWTR